MTTPPNNPEDQPKDRPEPDTEATEKPSASDSSSENGGLSIDVILPPTSKKKPGTGRFFVRGMATLLPAVLTLWLLIFAYGFVRDKIAAPINWGIQTAVIEFTDWPKANDDDYVDVWDNVMTPSQREEWEQISARERTKHRQARARAFDRWLVERFRNGTASPSIPYPYESPEFDQVLKVQRLAWMKQNPEIVQLARRAQLQERWNSIALGNWHLLDMIGLIVAVVLFYFAGVVMSNVIGRKFKEHGEKIVDRVPLIRRVYPAVKQVTDFFFADGDTAKQFNRVVAVEYPRKGLWSVGLVTGETMRSIQDRAGAECLTIFIPSSPTPFTGYVITVPQIETIDLDINIEDALKFAVSGGVLVPSSQRIDRSGNLFETSSNGTQASLPNATPGSANTKDKDDSTQTTGA